MRITEISASSFRNIDEARLMPSPGINLFLGDNAQGKTNLIEAVYMFTGQGSFRTAREHEMVMKGKSQSRLKLSFNGGGRDNDAEIILGEKRGAFLNGLDRETPRGLLGSFLAVVFSPTHLSLIKGGPALRRDFLDTAISQLKPRYSKILAGYNRSLSQRSALLKDALRHPSLIDTLEVWDQNLARLGGLIIKTRESYAERLSPEAARAYSDMTGGRESMSIEYRRSIGKDSDAEAALLRSLSENRQADLKLGTTSAGPHRDDLEVMIGGMSARGYGSQGQQRSAVLCLKLAEASLMASVSGDEPVMLLDDVLSELDKGRRDYLLGGLRGRQVFITCCGSEAAESLFSGKVFSVKAGVVTEN